MEDLFPQEFFDMVFNKKNSGQRYGQAVFNTAAEFYPEVASQLSGTIYDPFYNDKKISAFFTMLADLITR